MILYKKGQLLNIILVFVGVYQRMKVYIKANDTPTVKRSRCKKYFENHSGLTKEQIKLVDANRVAQQNELKAINTKICQDCINKLIMFIMLNGIQTY